MEFLKKSFLVIAICSLLIFADVFAHPLDISSSTLTLHERTIDAITYLHPSEVEAILGKRGLSMRSLTYGDYYVNAQYLFDYLTDRIHITANGQNCTLGKFTTTELWVDEIFTAGFPVRYEIVCSGKIKDFTLGIGIFSELPLQTNRVLLYDTSTGDPLFYKVLTAKQTEYRYMPWVAPTLPDSDGDGLSDEEEKLYRTDPSKADTDGDFYSDYEEVASGWNPLSKDLSPGQTLRTEAPSRAFVLPTGIAQSTNGNNGMTPGIYASGSTLSGSLTLASDDGTLFSIFKKILQRVDVLRSGHANFGSILPILGLLVLLGFLHALGPGHSKGFLVGYIVAEWAGIGASLLYALIFTLIHLADVVIITIFAKFVFQLFDAAAFLARIEMFWAIGLLGLSVFLFVTAVRLIRRKESSSILRTAYTGKKGLWLAFFAGLAPCTFAWSIVLVLFAIGRLDFALPFLGALGLGVFLCLGTLAIVTHFFRERVYRFDGRIAYYSPLFSSVFVFVLAIIFLAKFV